MRLLAIRNAEYFEGRSRNAAGRAFATLGTRYTVSRHERLRPSNKDKRGLLKLEQNMKPWQRSRSWCQKADTEGVSAFVFLVVVVSMGV